MAQAEVGALRVRLSLDAGEFSRGVKNAESALGKFARDVGAVAAGIKLERALTSAIDSFVYNIKRAFIEADKLGKMAQSIGIPVEELSKLKHAADLSGVSVESLGKGIGRLSRNMVEAGQGSRSAIQTFETLGINIRAADGSLKTMTQILPEIASKFAAMRDGPEKTALAMKLLGRAGADMIPLLNGGADGLREMMREAEQLGIVIDSKTAKSAELFNDNLTRLMRVKDGVITKITAELAPALALLSQRFIDAAKESGFVKQAAEAILNVMHFLAAEIGEVSIRVQGVAAEFRALWQALSATTWEDMKAGFKEFWGIGDETQRRVNALRTSLQDFREQAQMFGQGLANMPAADGKPPPIVDKMAQIKEATRLAADEARRWTDNMRAALDETLADGAIPISDKIKAVNKAMQEGIITQQKWGKLTRDLQKDQISQWGDLASATSTALTTIFKDSKIAAIASALINTASAIMKTLAQYGATPMGLAMAGLAAATGAAQVAAIRSTSEKGGGGGAPTAPSPGAASAAAATTPSPASATLTVQGINPSSLFSGEAMRALAQQMLQYQRDGGQVVLANA